MKKTIPTTLVLSLICCIISTNTDSAQEQHCIDTTYNHLYMNGINENSESLTYFEDFKFLINNTNDNPCASSVNTCNPLGVENDRFSITLIDNNKEYLVSKTSQKIYIDNHSEANKVKRQKTTHEFSQINTNCNAPIKIVEEEKSTCDLTGNIETLNYCAKDKLSEYSQTVILMKNENFYNAVLCVLKNILYYRFNIAKFFYTFHKRIGNKDKQCIDGSSIGNVEIMRKFMELSIEFVKNNKHKEHPEIAFVLEKDIEQYKDYEAVFIKNRERTKNIQVLYNSFEYKKIKSFNFMYSVNVNPVLSASPFRCLGAFLKPIFLQSLAVNSYYNMLSGLLEPLYEISLIINNCLNVILNTHFLDLSIFKARFCCCSIEVKQFFLFHWAICWITYFSRRCSLPNCLEKQHIAFNTITTYPRDFFTQFIVLVHYNISFDNKYTGNQFLDTQYAVILMESISSVLFDTDNGSNINLFQLIIYNLLKKIKEVYSHDIFPHSTVNNIRMKQTHKDHVVLSNKLLPALHCLVTVIFGVAQEANRLAVLRISQLSQEK